MARDLRTLRRSRSRVFRDSRTGRSSAARMPVSSPTTPRFPKHGARRKTSPGKPPVPGLGWSSPVVWGDHIFSRRRINTGAPEPFKAGSLRGGDIVKPAAPHRWMVTTSACRPERSAGSRKSAQRLPADGTHMKNSLLVGNAGHRRRARLRVLLQPRRVRLRPERQTGLVEADGPVHVPHRLGIGASPVLYEDRLFIVNDNETQAFIAAYDKRTGRGNLEARTDEGDQLDDAVRLEERAADRARSFPPRRRRSPTISRATCCGSCRACPPSTSRPRLPRTDCSSSIPAMSPMHCGRSMRSSPARRATSR